MTTFIELDRMLKNLPEDINRIIWNFLVRDCKKNCRCESCWIDCWKHHLD